LGDQWAGCGGKPSKKARLIGQFTLVSEKDFV
jgi:hypothetical protein